MADYATTENSYSPLTVFPVNTSYSVLYFVMYFYDIV